MRLYLSSFRVGDHPDRLIALLGNTGPGEIAVIANAMDSAPQGIRQAAVDREVNTLTELGFQPVELDLRDFFDQPKAAVQSAFERFPAVWARGGNAFMLRYALARSGADTALVALLQRDAIVYAGYSAGPCVLAPSLRGLEHCDFPQHVTDTWGDQPDRGMRHRRRALPSRGHPAPHPARQQTHMCVDTADRKTRSPRS